MAKSKTSKTSNPQKTRLESPKTFAEVVEEYLSVMGETVSGFMKSLGISEAQFYRWKKGDAKPRKDIVNRIATAIVKYGDDEGKEPNSGQIDQVLNELLLLSGYSAIQGRSANVVWQRIVEKREWTLAYTDVPPWAYRSPSGARGWVIKYAQRISEILGLSVNWKYIETWEGIEVAIRSGDVDAVAPFLIAVPERFFSYRFSKPCGDIYGVSAVAAIDNPDIRTIDQIPEKSALILVTKGEIGSMAISVLKREFKRREFFSIQSASDALINWNSNEEPIDPTNPDKGSFIPVLISAQETCNDILAKYQHEKKLQIVELPDARHIKTRTCFAFHLEEEKLEVAVNAAIEMLGQVEQFKSIEYN